MPEILYNKIGDSYNTTRKADPFITAQLIDLLGLRAGSLVLDIGCGTGNYTIALATAGLKMIGVEPSEKMLKTARTRHQQIQWMKGRAEQIPLADDSVHGIVGTLTLHHWTTIEQTFKELCRVLKAGGRLVFFSSDPQQMKGYWLNHYFPDMLQQSIRQMPSFQTIRKAAVLAGFEVNKPLPYDVQDNLQDQFLYVGKNNPELYFNESIRQGISSFAALAYAEEVKQGLAALRADLDQGRFAAIKKQYENQGGDYLFIQAKKNSV